MTTLDAPTDERRQAWSARLPRPGAAGWIGAGILTTVVVIVVAGPWIAPFDATERAGRPFQRPDGTHLLGTDDVGRDLFSLLILGARTSVMVGFGAAVLSMSVGVLVGGIAGLRGGWVDSLLMRFVDVVLVLPFLPLLVVAAAFAGRSLTVQIVTISLLTWARPARIVRAGVLSALRRGHVEAARAMGAGTTRVLFRHVSYPVAPLLIPLFTRAAMGAILLEASLAFLGLGNPLRASWGTMLYWANARSVVLTDAWLWWVLPPGLAIALLVVGLGLVGVAAEERLNPSVRTGARDD